METHSSNLAWKIPRTEEPSGLHSTRLQRVGHDGANKHSIPSNIWHWLRENGQKYLNFFLNTYKLPCTLSHHSLLSILKENCVSLQSTSLQSIPLTTSSQRLGYFSRFIPDFSASSSLSLSQTTFLNHYCIKKTKRPVILSYHPYLKKEQNSYLLCHWFTLQSHFSFNASELLTQVLNFRIKQIFIFSLQWLQLSL